MNIDILRLMFCICFVQRYNFEPHAKVCQPDEAAPGEQVLVLLIPKVFGGASYPGYVYGKCHTGSEPFTSARYIYLILVRRGGIF